VNQSESAVSCDLGQAGVLIVCQISLQKCKVRTLLSHRHNDVSDSKISRLAQTTSVRPVTVSAISLHFRKLVVRSLEVPDVFLLRDRSASRMANSFRQELIAELFDEES
jgi:hypothetical protein